MGRGNSKGPTDRFAEVFGSRRGAADQEENRYVLGEDDMVFERALEGHVAQGRHLGTIEAPSESNLGLILLFDGKPFGCVWRNPKKTGATRPRIFYSHEEQLTADEDTTEEWLAEVLPVIRRLRIQAIDVGVNAEVWANASLSEARAFC